MVKASFGVWLILLTVIGLPALTSGTSKKGSFGFYGGWSVRFDDYYRIDSRDDYFNIYERIDYYEKRGFSLMLGAFYQFKLSHRSSFEVEAEYQKIFSRRSVTYFETDQVTGSTPWNTYNDYFFSLLFNLLFRVAQTGKVGYYIKTGLGPGFRHFKFFPSKHSIFWNNLGDYTHLHLQLGPEIRIQTGLLKKPTPLILGIMVHYISPKKLEYDSAGGGYACLYMGLGF